LLTKIIIPSKLSELNTQNQLQFLIHTNANSTNKISKYVSNKIPCLVHFITLERLYEKIEAIFLPVKVDQKIKYHC